MVEETGRIDGDLRVAEDLVLRGLVTGTVTVASGGYCELHGIVGKDLVVEPAGIATLHGMVSHDVVNRGGDLEIYGVVSGVLHNERGSTLVDPKAVIGEIHGLP